MSRLRYVNVVGTVGSGNMTNVATSHTFTAPLVYGNAGSPTAVPTLAGTDYFLLTIFTSGVPEVVKVTAYNSVSGVATIVRAQEGTTGVAHSSGDVVTMAVYPTDTFDAFGAYPFYTGTYYSYDGLTNAAGTGTWASGSMGYSPFRVGVASASFDRFSVQCNTVGSGSQLRVGVYAADLTTGKPGALVLDAGTIIPAATGEQFASISLTLTRGDYWLAVLSEATGTGTWDIKNSVMTPNPFGRGGALIGATQNRGIQSTGVSSGGLPNPAPSQTIGTPADPIPYLRAA